MTTELFGTGYIPEPPTRLQRAGSIARGIKVAARLGAMAPEGALPRDPYMNMLQAKLEDCQGVWFAEGHFMMTGELLSPEFIWLWARAVDSGGVGRVDQETRMTELKNEGVTTSALVRAAAEHGSCPYNRWNRTRSDFHHAKLPPPLARTMAQKYLLDVRQIFATGDTLVNRHCDSIDKGYCPQIIVNVDPVFDALRSPIGPSNGESRGSHAVPGFRYRTRADGRFEIKVYTWGRTVWLSPERVGEVHRGAYLKGVKLLVDKAA